MARLRIIKSELKISSTPDSPPLNPTVTPTQFLRTIVQTNRQINLLLDDKFTPAEAYKQVTLAVG